MSKESRNATRAVRFAASWIFACGLFVAGCKSGGPDGTLCFADGECSSGQCNENRCLGSECDCEDGPCTEAGAPSSDCEPGWLCARFHSTSFTNAIYGTYSNTCVAPCPSCPEHYQCTSKSKFCSVIEGWQNPSVVITYTPENPAVGEPVTFRAEGSSPIGDTDFVFKWSFYSDSFNILEGAEVTKTYNRPMNDRADVTVTTGQGMRSSKKMQSFFVCSPRGGTCAYNSAGSSGCCTGLGCMPGGVCN